MEPQWLEWARRLQALAQVGLTYTQDPFDVERYEAVRTVAAEMMAAGSGAAPGDVLALFTQEVGYATPKVDVRGVVFRGDEVLLVKERADGRWTLPGGWADVCETPSEGVVREVREEAGYETRAVRLMALYDRSRHPHEPPFPYHVYKLFFLCEILGAADEALRQGHETEEVGFFARDALPPLSISRVTSQQLERLFVLRMAEGGPADFD